MRIKRGDTVKIIAGKDKGKTGEVLVVLPKSERLIVEGCNMITKHQKPNMQDNTGGIIHKEAPIHVSNVMYYDKSRKVASRIRYDWLEDGRKVRVAVKTGETLD